MTVCPYCNNEMEKGRFQAYAVGTMPVAYLRWAGESQFEEKGFRGWLNRKFIEIKISKDGYYHKSYHCATCEKVFAQFPTKPQKVRKKKNKDDLWTRKS
ncbi:MAG: PF20097 family protein [Defluviitaleaceae bacterium]|nr:PF20097 family protein [Defluviitaleaceae bacterium]